MRKETSRHVPKQRSPNRSSPQPIDLSDWRSRVRPLILRDLVEQTRNLSWSRRLITLLLEELHVSDEFLNLVESNDYPDPEQYAQLVAIALVLRHSWFPEDLSDTTVWLGLPPTILTEPKLVSSLQPATADTGAVPDKRPSRRARTALKGDPT